MTGEASSTNNTLFTEKQRAVAANAKFAALQHRLFIHLKSEGVAASTVVVEEVTSQPVKPSDLKKEKASLKEAATKDSGNKLELKISIGDFEFTAIARRADLTENESKEDKQADDYSITAVHVPKDLYSAQEFDSDQTARLSQMVKILVNELKHGDSLPKQFEFGDGSTRYSDEFKQNLQGVLKDYCSGVEVVIDFKESAAPKKSIPSTGAAASRGPRSVSPAPQQSRGPDPLLDGGLGLWQK